MHPPPGNGSGGPAGNFPAGLPGPSNGGAGHGFCVPPGGGIGGFLGSFPGGPPGQGPGGDDPPPAGPPHGVHLLVVVCQVHQTPDQGPSRQDGYGGMLNTGYNVNQDEQVPDLVTVDQRLNFATLVRVKLKVFTGSLDDKLFKFFDEFEEFSESFCLTDADKVVCFEALLGDNPKAALKQLNRGQRSSYQVIKEFSLCNYHITGMVEWLAVAFNLMVHNLKDNLRQFLRKLE